MKLLWGDLHNHCGITYGLGSLENALDVAAQHLDFVSVTPHAFWPDIPPRTPDTDFLVDFHEKGFAKIEKNWEEVKRTIDGANQPTKLSTFFSFEMHSSRWGDCHFVSPDSSLKIEKRENAAEVIAAQDARTIAIPHHIGYTPGYRGIDWQGFREDISPVVEVVSKHGCAMHENSGFPYYHDMGPLDPRNTVYQGLKAGKRFGFVGSTDHHAGFPGSYGDGKLAVWARENTREAIFEAILNRRTYAVTAARIQCQFSVNGVPMGGELPHSDRYRVEYGAIGSNALDRIVIYRDLKPIHVVDGLALPETGNRYKLCLELGWGDNLEQPYPWEVNVRIKGGRILDCEPCLRGRSVLSPTQRISGGEDINRSRFELKQQEDRVHFFCETYRNPSTLNPSTAMLVMEVCADRDAEILYEINGRKIEMRLQNILEAGMSGHVKPYNSQAFKLHTAVPCGKYAASGTFELPESDGSIYHMEVRQFDGSAAYISPIFVKREGLA